MKRKKVFSYGVIPLRKRDGAWEVLIIQHHGGHWAFPKGRPEEGEEPFHTATRELQEETGLSVVNMIEQEPVKEEYIFRWEGDLIYKTVFYFLAEVEGAVKLQEEELSDFKWLSIPEARAQATFPECKNLCTEVEAYLENNPLNNP